MPAPAGKRHAARVSRWQRLRAAAWMLATVGIAHASAGASAMPGPGHWARIAGHAMYYELRGRGRPLLLLHGGGDSGTHSFERQLGSFARTHRIIVPDQVGQGRTPDVPGPLSYSAMLRDTVALLRQLGAGRVDVVGFSDGGILALMLAVRHPEMVRRVVVSGVNIAPEGLTDAQLDDLRAAPPNDAPRTMDEKLRQLWLTSPTDQELNVGLLARIHSPVLIMSGDRDAITLEHTIKIYHAIADAELYVVPGTDHGTFHGRPEWVNPVALEFLDRPDPPRQPAGGARSRR
jgi:pimeloyl-ACP methyl ester carboxylesterase